MTGDRGEGRGSGGAPEANGAEGPAVKICGLTRREDVLAAVDAGAAFLGVVLAQSPRRVSATRAARLVRDLPAHAVGVFVDAAPGDVLRAAGTVPLDVAQLHGSESPETCEAIREAGVRVWKALRPTSAGELAEGAARYRGSVDGLLVEGHSEEAAGGTGTAFPHEWWGRAGLGGEGGPEGPTLILAGGLTPENVAGALARTSPRVVDVSSGVEREPGVKDPERIRAFVEAVRSAPAGTGGGAS